jgi:hypothetical protein
LGIDFEAVKTLKKYLNEILADSRQIEKAHQRGGKHDSPGATARLHAHRGKLCFEAQRLMEQSGINSFATDSDTYNDGWDLRKF